MDYSIKGINNVDNYRVGKFLGLFSTKNNILAPQHHPIYSGKS